MTSSIAPLLGKNQLNLTKTINWKTICVLMRKKYKGYQKEKGLMMCPICLNRKLLVMQFAKIT
jgi:hypothetical protein